MDVTKSCNPLPSKIASHIREINVGALASNSGIETQLCPPPNPYGEFVQQIFEHDEAVEGAAVINKDETHKLRVAPLFSCGVHAFANFAAKKDSSATFPQYGVVGLQQEQIQGTNIGRNLQERIILSNTEEPFSTFICGSQGSGKSHTLSCLLENSLLPNNKIGVLKTPLTGLVFHYDKFAGFDVSQACESAYLSSTSVKVRVLVAPTSLKKMSRQYSNLPGMSDALSKPKVMPLYFNQRQLSVDMMMTLMAVHETGTAAPLYISTIRQVLRDIAVVRQDDPGFDYADFRYRLAELPLSEGQCMPLNLRLELLESFLLGSEQTDKALKAFSEAWRFDPGTLTIIDLSDQFVNEADACALFSICLKLFMDGWRSNPRVIVLDEAHKFLTNTSEASKLTKDLVSIIRQQRHLNSRVIIATQEPTVSGDLLDLCNVSVVHRFNSPKWYNTIKTHIAGAHANIGHPNDLFEEIVALQTGEAIVFCPTAVLMGHDCLPKSMNSEFMRLKVRARITSDGGKSFRATDEFNIKDTEVLNDLPTLMPLRSNSLPRPGSLGGKSKGKREFKTAVLRKDSTKTSGPLIQAPKSTQVLPNNESPRTQDHGVTATCSSASTTTATGNEPPRSQITEIYQSLLEERLQAAHSEFWQRDPTLYAQHPNRVVKQILGRVSIQFQLPRRHLRDHDSKWDVNLESPVTILRRLLKKSCDDDGVPSSERAKFSWLR